MFIKEMKNIHQGTRKIKKIKLEILIEKQQNILQESAIPLG